MPVGHTRSCLRHRPAEAEPLARRAVELDSESAESQAILGITLDWNSKITEAIGACLAATELAPDYALGYACLAEAYGDQGRTPTRFRQPSTPWNWRRMTPWCGARLGYIRELMGQLSRRCERV